MVRVTTDCTHSGMGLDMDDIKCGEAGTVFDDQLTN